MDPFANKIRINTHNRMSRMELTLAQRGTLESRIDQITGDMITDMASYVLAMPTERIRINRQWPRDWWQAFRERWAPKWWLNRHPVQYASIDVDRQLYGPICPHVDAPDGHLEWLSTHNPLPKACSARPE